MLLFYLQRRYSTAVGSITVMIIRRCTWFTFHYLTDIVETYLTPLHLIQFQLDRAALVHDIVKCLPTEEDLLSDRQARDIAQQSFDRLSEATLIRNDPAILGELISAIDALRQGSLDDDYHAAVADAYQNAFIEGYLL
jgi:hypothetical protein